MKEDLRATRRPLGDEMDVDAEACENMSSSGAGMSSSWAAPSESWARVSEAQWEAPADPADDDSFIYVTVDADSDSEAWNTDDPQPSHSQHSFSP